MPHRIEIVSIGLDTKAEILKKFLGIKRCRLADVYTIDKKLTALELERAGQMLINSVVEEARIDRAWNFEEFNLAIEIGFLPGVTDNVAGTVREAIEDLLKLKFGDGEGVYSSSIIFVGDNLPRKQVIDLADGLYNPLIQRMEVRDRGNAAATIPAVKLKQEVRVDEVNLNISDEELTTLGEQGIADNSGIRRGPLALDLKCMKAIQAHFRKKGRKPTDIELESIAQTWSEHCKHTIFADPMDEIKDGLYKTFIKGATQEIRRRKGGRDICVSVFSDNSGAIVFDDEWLITHKVETHNSPCALDPFGGAVTGIVGVNRDAIGFGLGAKPVINCYGFCLADPTDNSVLYRKPGQKQKMLSAKRMMEGVVRGVNVGGNCSGIPTPQGFVYFDKSYRGKPLVFVGTVGLIGRKRGGKLLYKKKARAGDYVVMVGGRVGRDGIHGATFSSQSLRESSPAGAVQIGDPITQKKLSDALVKEARDLNLYNSITDNGAGGLSCSVAEMAKESGGCVVELSKVPTKYPGLAPWQIWVSESQERMTLAVDPDKWPKFLDLMTKRGVEASVIGRFTKSGRCVVKFLGKKIMDVEMGFLHNGLPRRPMTTSFEKKPRPEPVLTKTNDLTTSLEMRLNELNIGGYEFISGQYDYEVQGGSVIKPLQGRNRVNGEASVIRPVLSSKRGVVISQALWPELSPIDTYDMAAYAIDTAIRNAVAVGADLDHLALLDNFCWCSSNEKERLGQLKRAAQACFDYAVTYGTPFISGKDSMFNDFEGFDEENNRVKISILPTLLVSSIGVIKDVDRVVSLDVKFPGDLVYVLGETVGHYPARVDGQKNKRLYRALYGAIRKGLVASSISVNRGGLAVALAKMSMAGGLGLAVGLEASALFSESMGRIIVGVNPKNKKEFERIMAGNNFAGIGRVTGEEEILIKNQAGQTIVDLDLKTALKAYKSRLSQY